MTSVVRPGELEVQKFLRAGNTLEDLKAQFAIKTRRHIKYNNLVSLKYDQTESPMGFQIVQECRGLILDENNNWAVVAHGFNKFFNYGEGHAAVLDWNNTKFLEKLDGSLCMLYWYDNDWHVATSGTPDASGEVGDTKCTFKDLFWKTWNSLGYKLPTRKMWTFMFELMTPYNRIVVKHEKSRIVLIGARTQVTGKEIDIFTDDYEGNWEIVKQYDISSLDSALSTFKDISPLTQEGYVCLDASFRRIKVKHPGYVALHHFASNLTTKALLEIVRSGEIDEVVASFPEWKSALLEFKKRYEDLVNHLEKAYPECVKDMDSRKSFAMKAKETRIPSVMFCLLDGKISAVREYTSSMDIGVLKTVLDLNKYELNIHGQVENGN